MVPARAVLVVLLAAPMLAGCLSPTDEEDDEASAEAMERLAPNEWRALLSEPAYTDFETTVHYIEAADGTQLSLYLSLPSGLEADAEIPTLMELTPYQGTSENTPLGVTRPTGYWADYIRHGVAFVRADARGTNASEGCLDFGGQKDRDDAKVFVDWIRAQEWSNGIVVTDGVSHPGMGSIVAHTGSPELTAALAVAPVVSYYQDEWLQGAKFEDQLNGPFYQLTELEPAIHTTPEGAMSQLAPCTGQTVIDYDQVDGPFTAYWQDRDLSLHVDQAIAARKPILLEHGFVDLNVHPDHTQKYWDALPDDFPKRLVMGWWYHQRPDFDGHPFATPEDAGGNTDTHYRQRFLDATLLGIDNGFWAEPRVLVEDSRHVWHEGDQWPLEPSETVVWYPADDGAFGPDAPGDGGVSYQDLADAPTRGHWTGSHVAFRSEPLDKAMLVNGAPVVHLVASSSEPETKWVAYLLDEAPDGSWERITHGYADSHSHGEWEQWLDMEPGTAYTWDLQLMPTAVVVEEGHRVTLVVTSQDSRRNPNNEDYCWNDHRRPDDTGCYDPSGIVPATTVGRAENTVHLGPEGTSVTLAWVDPSLTAKPPWPAG